MKPRGRRPNVPLAIRFHKLFVQGKPDECWLWQGAKTAAKGGHGRLQGEGAKRLVLAHRVAYELHHGVEVPPGVMVLHTCDVGLCVNPAHLFLGSQGDNIADMHAKGRSNISHPGEKNPRAVLTEDDVRYIREEVLRGRLQKDIAAEFGITRSLVGQISQGRIWKHLR